MKIRSLQNFCAGLMFILIGSGFGLGALKYSMGTASRMGPAYFPSILGWGTAILGVIILIEGFTLDQERPSPVAWKPVGFVLASVCAFAALINTGGLITATVALIFLSAWGGPNFILKEAVISAVLMAITVWLIFSVALGLPFRLFPWSY